MSDNEAIIKEMTEEVRDIYAVQHFIMLHPDLPVSWVAGKRAYIATPHAVDADGLIDYDTVDVAEVARLVRVMKDGGTVEKHSSDDYMTYTRKLGRKGKIEFSISRKAVCEAVVTGTKVITVPDPNAPTITKTVDVIEWVCAPILDKAIA